MTDQLAALVLAIGGTVFVVAMVAVFCRHGVPAIARRSLARAVPDAATPELAVRIDDRLHCGCRPREPIYGCVLCGHQRCTTHRDDDHACAQVVREREPLPRRTARLDPDAHDWDAALRNLTGGTPS